MKYNELPIFFKEAIKKNLFWPTSPFITKLICDPFFRHRGRRQHNTDINLSQIKRVLVIRLDEIGDVVMTSPFLRELRRNLPNAWITFVVKPSVLNLVENCPYVDEVLASDWEGGRDIHRFQRHWHAWKMARKHLWHRKFDLAILPRRDTDQSHGAFLAYFSGAHLRVGYLSNVLDGKLTYFRNNGHLLTHVINDYALKHEVEYNLEIIRFLGGKVQNEQMEIWLNPVDERFAEQVLKSHGIQPHDLLVGFAPGAAHQKRMWPLSRFVTLGSWLKNEYNAVIVVVGGQGEELLGQVLQQSIDGTVVNIVGKTTLRQTAAVLKSCRLFVGNDSGPMHLAAASSVPVIEISAHPLDGSPFNASSPSRFGPWGVPHRILQPGKAIPPCSDSCISEEAHCISGVAVDQVKEAVVQILSNQGYSRQTKKTFHEI